MPVIRVSDFRTSKVTRNETTPDSPTVKRNEGIEETNNGKNKEKWLRSSLRKARNRSRWRRIWVDED